MGQSRLGYLSNLLHYQLIQIRVSRKEFPFNSFPIRSGILPNIEMEQGKVVLALLLN